ncbi:MAG: endonuclease [Bacteroidaceae bacterium]|nr:endonuclease [Bacteroidaceae bacterium]
MKRYYLLFITLLGMTVSFAQTFNKAGYYAAADGQKGAALKTALASCISSHTTISYNSLCDAYVTTDTRPDGKVWDMYSCTTNFVHNQDNKGNYSKEGDMYNREHSFPKSWFDNASPMSSDLVHVIPTDGYVNNRRSNYPFGEVGSITYQSNEGFSKLGESKTPGYSGKVFEPNDEYKGDFARIYFYMVTCYESRVASWSSEMLAGNKYPAFSQWALDMLLRWAKEDPVSQKEIDRNNGVYKLQKNRNPFVDFPGLEQYVWGTRKDIAFDLDNYQSTIDDDTPVDADVKKPVFSPAGGVVAKGSTVTITSPTEGCYIYYSVNGGDYQCLYPPVEVTINENTLVTAYAWLNNTAKSETAQAYYTVQTGGSDDTDTPGDPNTFDLVTSAADLELGASYLIVSTEANQAMGDDWEGKYVRNTANVSVSGSKVTTPTNTAGRPYTFTITKAEGGYYIYAEAEQVYLAYEGDGNKLQSIASPEKTAIWAITFDKGNAVIESTVAEGRTIQYNAASPRFATYTSAQTPVQLFRRQAAPTAVESVETDRQPVVIFDLSGRRVQCPTRGLYIVNGKKVCVQ